LIPQQADRLAFFDAVKAFVAKQRKDYKDNGGLPQNLAKNVLPLIVAEMHRLLFDLLLSGVIKMDGDDHLSVGYFDLQADLLNM
jgi:hypothetical protein